MRTREQLLTALVAAVVFAFSVASVQAQGLGVSAGLNFNSLSDIDTGDRQATFDNSQGWHVAVWFDLPLGPLAVRPGLRYMDAGTVFEGVREGGIGLGDDVNVRLIEIPIDLRVRLGVPIITPYVLAGPVLRFPTSANEDEDRLQSFSFAGQLGAGVELGLGGIRLFPEIKYTFGISRFTKESYTVRGILFEPDENQQLNAFMLSLGFGL